MTDQRLRDLARLVAELETGGCLSDPEWKRAFASVPRYLFVPRFFLPLPDGRWQGIDQEHPEYWGMIYADTTLTTQLDGALEPDPTTRPVSGTGTSSSTQPSLMAAMLEALRLDGGERVLEIGTGTGYNAALLSHRLGSPQVTTVEIDPTVARHARGRLNQAGYQPTVIVDDGQYGDADRVGYDRIIATCSVPTIPRAWISHVRDGGIILTSLWRDLGGAPLVRLTVGDNAAQGFFLPTPGGFMPVRSAQQTREALSVATHQTGQTRPTTVPSEVLHHRDAGLWLALLVPGVTWLGFTPTDGNDQVWLFAPDSSWAVVDDQAGSVEQYGPRALWDEIETAYEQWRGAGSPARDRLGLTVTPTEHRFWFDTPDPDHTLPLA